MQDIGTGSSVADIGECQAACDAEPTCNAAAFYDPAFPESGLNCFLKVLGDACGLPEDATADPNATLSLKCDDPLAAAPAVAVAPAAAAADAPVGVGVTDASAADAPVDDEATAREADVGTDTTVAGGEAVAPEGSSAAGMCASVAAVAVAGALALM